MVRQTVSARAGRWALRAVTTGGQRIARGEAVISVIRSANRDAAVFDAADQLRIDRSPNPHIAFGQGIHFCRRQPRHLFQGQWGQWREGLRPSQIRQVRVLAGPLLSELGYSLDSDAAEGWLPTRGFLP